jgi:hypothetical protein
MGIDREKRNFWVHNVCVRVQRFKVLRKWFRLVSQDLKIYRATYHIMEASRMGREN